MALYRLSPSLSPFVFTVWLPPRGKVHFILLKEFKVGGRMDGWGHWSAEITGFYYFWSSALVRFSRNALACPLDSIWKGGGGCAVCLFAVREPLGEQ